MSRKFFTTDEAVAMLPDGDIVHGFRQSAGVALIGCDWTRAEAIAAITVGKPEKSGPVATGMGHGLYVDGVFFETRKPPEAGKP